MFGMTQNIGQTENIFDWPKKTSLFLLKIRWLFSTTAEGRLPHWFSKRVIRQKIFLAKNDFAQKNILRRNAQVIVISH